MPLFRRRRRPPAPARPAGFGPVPATTEQRVAAIEAAVAGIADERSVGVPYLPLRGHRRAEAAVRHFLPEAEERRAVSHRTSQDLVALLRLGVLDLDGIDRLLGVTAAAYRNHGIEPELWRAGEAIAADATWILADVGAGHGPNLDRWRTDDDYVVSSLAAQLVVLLRHRSQQAAARRRPPGA